MFVRTHILTMLMLALALVAAGCGDLTEPPSRATAAEDPLSSVRVQDRFGGPSNFVSNPGFERGIAPWAPWSANSVLAASRDEAKSQRRSVRVTPTAPEPYGIQLLNVVGVPEKDDRYELAAWIRSDGGPREITLMLTAYGGPGDGETVAQSRFLVRGDWQRVRIRGRVRETGRTSLSAFVLVLSSIGTGESFYVDAVTLVAR